MELLDTSSRSLLLAAVLSLPLCASAANPPAVSCPLEKVAEIRDNDVCALQGGDYLSNRRSGKIHGALDLNAAVGDKVLATKAGIVVVAAEKWADMGTAVIIDHGDGGYTVYGHLDEAKVKKGAKVVAGQQVGTVGFTGNSDCLQKNKLPPHLHFGYLNAGKAGLARRDYPIAEIERWGAAWEEAFYGDVLAVGVQHPQMAIEGLTCWAKPQKKPPPKKS
ncbi:M23 family metallopeptidase [Steroidobacter flavus]|uniref:M23 family metallopeptidase n=1 Tax=Steroidobacter flavus TaxID=1842136 RepID=A0ABV8T143_9GAMM